MLSILAGLFRLSAAFSMQISDTGISNPRLDTTVIHKTADFAITGRGDHAAWDQTSWLPFTKLDSGGKSYTSKSKMLYSEKGVYLLFDGDDERISTKNYRDDDEIYEGDVFEFFFRADTSRPAYFEYEINPLGRQLILILSGLPHSNLAWSPWGYEYRKNPLIRKKVTLSGPAKKTGEEIKISRTPKPGLAIGSWRAEIFFPYELLGILPGLPPQSGTIWRANFCRIDYDSGKMIQWSWSKKIKKSFHELKNLGFIQFE